MWLPDQMLIAEKIDYLRENWEHLCNESFRFMDKHPETSRNMWIESGKICKLWLTLKANKFEQENM